jgi:hypothetical protein
MLCYKDKIFCPFYESCADGHDCSKALTQEVRESARHFELPINQYAGEPKCWREKPASTDR